MLLHGDLQISYKPTIFLKLKLWFKKNLTIFLVSVCLISIAFSITAQFLKLKLLPITIVDDLAHHVAMAENFLIALRSGQFVPCLQNPPFADLPDLPLFQYYGFMTGLVALPGMLLSLSSFKALMMGIFIFRIGGAAGVYWIGRLLGGNRKVSVLAVLVYYMTPYIISNLYGRVAVPETLAHCELPFLIIGLLLGLQGSLIAGAIILAITVLLLSLTHPIFLLYGCISLVLIMIVSLSQRIFVTGMVGLTSGILLSAFRWYPVLTSNITSKFIDHVSPASKSSLTSWDGLFWFPKSLEALLHPAIGPFNLMATSSNSYLYLTPGWFTLPVLFGLIVCLTQKGQLTEKLIILIPSILFLLLAFGIGDLYQFFPHITWNVQFPYRLLSFVGLFTAIGLPLLLPRLKIVGFVIFAFLAVIQSAGLIIHHTYREPLVVGANDIAKVYAFYGYAIADEDSISEGDNWMFDYAKRFYPTLPFQGLSTPLDPEAVIGFVNSATKQYIHIEGIAKSDSKMINIWLEDGDNPPVKTNFQRISSGPFSLTFELPIPSKYYRLVTNPKLSLSIKKNSTIIRLKHAEGYPFHFLRHSFNKTPMELRLSGQSIFTDQTIDLWLAKPSNPMIPVTGKVSIPPGQFYIKLPYPNNADEYILVTSNTRIPAEYNRASADLRNLSLNLKSAEFVPQATPALPRITYEWVDTKKIGAYSRLYTIRKAAWWTPEGKTHYPGTVELPIAYNPLFTFTQNNHLLKASPDEKARTNIMTNDLTHGIIARYRLPLFSYLGPIAGLIILMGFATFCRRQSRS